MAILADLQGPLSAYGDPLGEAFQLRDDVLGAFGEAAVTGKPVGDDLREGKPTPLLAIAVSRSSAPQMAVLAEVGQEDLTVEAVARIQEVMLATGALTEIEVTIDALTTEAIGAIGTAPISPGACAALVDLAEFVAWRLT